MTTETVADWARAGRRSRGWTQSEAARELARATGQSISRVWLSRIENGQPPSRSLLRALEGLYGAAPETDVTTERLLEAIELRGETIDAALVDLRLRLDLLISGLLGRGLTTGLETTDVQEFLDELARRESSGTPPRSTSRPGRTPARG